MASESKVFTLLDREELGEKEYEERNNLFNSLHDDVINELKSAFKEGIHFVNRWNLYINPLACSELFREAALWYYLHVFWIFNC